MKRSFTFLMSLFLTIGTMWAQTFPETSTAEAPKYYTIASYNRGGYLTSVGEGKGVEHIATTKGSLWYFVQADENGGLYFCNMAGGFLAADKTVSETAGVWYVLSNGVNTEGASISSTNPISSGSCVDANNYNTGVGAWHPQAGDWEGTTWVFAEVTDFSTIFNVDEAKAAAKAELDVLASVSVIYPDAAEAKAAIDAVEAEGTGSSQLSAAIDAVNQCEDDYKAAALQALGGRYFAINTPARESGFMKLAGNQVSGAADASSSAAIWQFEYADGVVKVFNPYTGKYLCEPGNNSNIVAVTENAAEAGAYQLVVNADAENEEAKVKLTSNGKSIHMASNSVLVRWDDGGASEWTVAEVTDFAEIVSLHKAAALATVEAYAQLPAIFDVVATQEAINGVTATDWSAFAAIDEAANTVVPTGKFAFQSTSNDNHRDSVWVSANMETLKAIGAAEQDKNAHWTLKPASGGAFYIYNVANELYLGAPSGNCTLTAEPVAAYTVEVIDAENNVVEFKCGSETLHASNHEDDKLLSYDADEAASRWTIVAVDELYDLSEGTWSDATSYIVNADMSSEQGWTLDGLDGHYAESNQVNNFYAGWGGLDRTSAYNRQEITLPAGIYRLTGKAFFRQGENSNPEKSLGYMFIGDNRVLVPSLASAGVTPLANNAGDAQKAFYTDNLYTVVLDFTLEEETTLSVGYECTFDEARSWFITGAMTLEKKITLKDNFLAQAAEFSAFGQSSMAMYSLGAVQEKWAEVMAVVDPLYFAISEGEEVLKFDVEAAMELMATSMAEMKPVLEYYDGTFSDTKWAMYDVQENFTANSDEVSAAFDDALTAALNVSAVTTVAELEAKVAEMEAARREFAKHATPSTEYDMTFLLVNPSFETGDLTGWTIRRESADTGVRTYATEGTHGKYLFNSWWNGVYLTQDAVDIPNGQYRLTVAFAGGDDGNDATAYIIANNDTLGVNLKSGNPFTDFSVVTNVINNKLHIATVGGNDDDTAENPVGSFSQDGYWWYKADNFRLEYVDELPLEVILPLKKEAFLARAAEFEEFINAEVDWSWQTINSTYLYEVQDEVLGNADYEIVGLVDRMDEVTDVAVLDQWMVRMDEVEALLTEVNAAAVGYNYFKGLLEEAMGYSTMVNEEECRAAYGVFEQYTYGFSMMASSVEAIANAAVELKAAYIQFVSNAAPAEGTMFDMTFAITNPNFEKNVEGWTCVKTGHNGGEGYDGIGGIAEIADWGATSWEASMLQVLNGLPNGKYVVKAAWMAASGIEMAFAANTDTVKVVGIGDNGGNIAKDGSVVEMGQGHRGWQYVEVEGTVEDSTLTIAVNSSSSAQYQWSNADAFELYYAGATPAPVEPFTDFYTNPSGEEALDKLGNIELFFGVAVEEVVVNESDELKATLTTPTIVDDEYFVASVWTSCYDNEDDPENVFKYITFELEETYTEPGEYVLTIPEGLFTVDGAPNAATEVYFTVKEPAPVVEFDATIVGVTPAAGEVTELSTIIVQFSNDEVMPQSNIFLTDEAGTEYEFQLDTNHPDYTQAKYVAMNGAITAAGTYTLDCSQIDHATSLWPLETINPFEGTYSWTIAETVGAYADFFVIPFEGDELAEFSYAELMIFDLVENVELSGEVHATLTTPTNVDGEILVASYYLDESIPEEPCHVITFEGTQVYTAPGAYTLTIPEGLFTVDGAPNAATVVNFTVMEPVVVEFEAKIVSVTPAEGEVTELSEIIVQFDSDIVVPYSNVYVTNEAGDEFEFELDPNHSDYTQARYFAKDGAITAAGTYTFDCSQIDHVVNRLTRERIYPFTGTYTWTIKAGENGIDNINVDADAVIYDIHGRRVTEMTKGIYIVNGKKVIKK